MLLLLEENCLLFITLLVMNDNNVASKSESSKVNSRSNGNGQTFLLKSGQSIPFVFRVFYSPTLDPFIFTCHRMRWRGGGKNWKMSIKNDRITTRGLFRHTFYDKRGQWKKISLTGIRNELKYFLSLLRIGHRVYQRGRRHTTD